MTKISVFFLKMDLIHLSFLVISAYTVCQDLADMYSEI